MVSDENQELISCRSKHRKQHKRNYLPKPISSALKIRVPVSKVPCIHMIISITKENVVRYEYRLKKVQSAVAR